MPRLVRPGAQLWTLVPRVGRAFDPGRHRKTHGIVLVSCVGPLETKLHKGACYLVVAQETRD
jgi:hypothetical protein